jgi:small subunit ribosomal protein S18|tara:strand:+ start:486 stop:704 length:219 start_codon:yes stop_codon:yes gene_type:complete
MRNIIENNVEISSVIDDVNYKDTKVLANFINDQGKIMPRRVTGLSSKQQKRIAKLIKKARIASLLPFVIGKV